MSEVQGVDVNIMGREFKVSCTDDEREGLIKAVNFLDKKMRDIRDTGKVIGVERIAIMAALNLAHELLTARSGGFDIGDFKRRIVAMQEQIDEAVAEQNNLF
jgi:cell division protein ZapA